MSKKAGFVVIIGKPNAGKSTLINSLIDFNLSIVNRKAQTTRNRILGILNGKDFQVVFIDTPGILKPEYELHNFMMSEIINSLEEADLIILLLDALNPETGFFDTFENNYGNYLRNRSFVIVLNKIDLIKKNDLLPLINNVSQRFPGIDILPVSALKKENIQNLINLILDKLPAGEFFFDEDSLTDKSEKFLSAEIIREQILSLYHQEIPYSCLVHISEFKERSEKLVYINADVILERESQKAIIIGKKGEGLKRLGERARKKLENFLDKKVFLSLFVKVKKDWRNEKNYINKNINQ